MPKEEERREEEGLEELDLDNLFVPDEETGVEEPAAAVPEEGVVEEPAAPVEGEAAAKEEPVFDEKIEAAFAKRLSAAEEKIRREFEEKYGPPPETHEGATPVPGEPQQQQQQPIKPLTKEQIDELAEQLNLSPEAVEILYHQQMAIYQQRDQILKQQDYLHNLEDTASKSEAKNEIERQREDNPLLPDFNDKALTKIRKDYKSRYGIVLPWKEAYNHYVAQEVMDGTIPRKVEQETLKGVADRGKGAVPRTKGKSTKKPDIWDLSADQFGKLKEQALQGKLKKS